MRPTDIYPKRLIDELLRLYRLDADWLEVEAVPGEPNKFLTTLKYGTPLAQDWKHGTDPLADFVSSHWLGTGPKVFKPTEEQCAALARTEVNLSVVDYSQPFPALLVVLPDRYLPFKYVTCFHRDGLMSVVVEDADPTKGGLVIVIKNPDIVIDEALGTFYDLDQDATTSAHVAARISVNSCLALSHYGCHADYLFPKEVESDRRLAKERTERGERARQRLPLAVMNVAFDREVVLHRTERRERDPDAAPTGRSVSFHWRRGHWAMQACGVGRSERKRILRPPVMVRADLLIGDPSAATTTYRS